MIDSNNFKASRDRARMALTPEEAKNSYGYYIDIANDWENFRTYEDLILWFGIHSTHIVQFPEVSHNLGALSDEEIDWCRRYVAFYDRVGRVLATTDARTDLRYDLAETLTDWRTILRFRDLPAKILDFGAGGGRQCLSSFLRNPDNIYTAVDGTLAGYTVQNLVFSMMDALGRRATTYDFIDYEVATKPYPEIEKAEPGSRYHVPVWMAEEKIPARFYDVIIAAHVHNELSGYDFMRLINCVDKGLADDGIFYCRSEIFVFEARDFFDAVDLHAMEIVQILRDRGIVPVHCTYDTYLTTVFARIGSIHHKRALESADPACSFLDITRNREMSDHAAVKFIESTVKRSAEAEGMKVALLGKDGPFYGRFIAPVEGEFKQSISITDEAILDGSAIKDLVAFDPDVLIIASHNCGGVEAAVKQAFPNEKFFLRQHQFYPVVFLFGERWSKVASIWRDPILCPADIGIPPEGIPTEDILARR